MSLACFFIGQMPGFFASNRASKEAAKTINIASTYRLTCGNAPFIYLIAQGALASALQPLT